MTTGVAGDGLSWDGTQWVNIGPLRGPPGSSSSDNSIEINEVAVHLFVAAPTSFNDTGTVGHWAWDGVYMWACVATDTWVNWLPRRQ